MTSGIYYVSSAPGQPSADEELATLLSQMAAMGLTAESRR
jgi:hypothetical protein